MQVRYDPEKDIYRDCKWCQGKGCLYCKSEADKAYRAAFPNGPEPLATFDLSSEEDANRLREFVKNTLGSNNPSP